MAMIGLSARLALVGALSGCVLTLPFDSLSGGPSRPTSSYSFEEGTGDLAADSAGRNLALLRKEVTPPMWTTEGKRGGGLDFGEDGWLEVPTLSGPNVPQRGTLAMWVKLRAFAKDDYAELFSLEEENSPADERDDTTSLGLYLNATEVLVETFGTVEKRLATPSVSLNNWALLVVGWDVEANQVLLFVRQEGMPAFPLQTDTLPEGFALKAPYFTFSAADATLDEVRFYDRLLTPDEVASVD
jgi:hypothetical protein